MTEFRPVVCRSDTGDGGWSYHPPGSLPQDIAEGIAPVLASGPSTRNSSGRWMRPNDTDWRRAKRAYDRVTP